METTNTKPLSRANISGLPKKYYDAGFNNYDAYNGFLESAKKFCVQFYQGLTEKKSLVLCGKVGSGKTHLAISVLRNLPEVPSQFGVNGVRKQTAQFIVADEFFMMLNDAATTKGVSKLDLIKQLLSHDMICLDDLGVYNLTAAKIENLYAFINGAYLDDKRIIITTNFLMKDFDQYDRRIASRLVEMAHIIAFDQEDFRKRNNNKQ